MPSDTPEGLTPREALDRIAALPAEVNPNGLAWLSADDVAEILAEVAPEPGGVLDRDQARAFLLRDTVLSEEAVDRVLDRLARCVRPAAIDRDRTRFRGMDDREALLHLMREHDWTDDDNMERLVDEVLALVRPVAGVTLTPEEKALAARALQGWSHEWASKWYAGDTDDEAGTSLALAARLEAES